MKQPIAMRCTKEQFENIKPKLEEIGKIGILSGAFKKYQYLTNNYEKEINKCFDFVNDELLFESEHKNNIHEEWNEKIFLEACGIETEETFTITESQIKTLYDIFEVSQTYQGQDYLKEWFPESEAFESEVKLEVGKWYKRPHNKALFCVLENPDKEPFKIYGFNNAGIWMENDTPRTFTDNEIEATEQEVFEALREEAMKRYKVGDWVKSFYHKGNPELCIKELDFNLNAQKGINCSGTNHYMPVVFENGKWAEIIDSITLSEAEQQLGKKIIV